MSRHLPLLRRMCLIVGALLLLTSTAFAQREQKTYRCRAKDAVSVRLDGTLDKLVGEGAIKTFDKVVFDIPGGHITFPDTLETKEWTVQKTTRGDDYVLFPRTAFHRRRTIADATTTFIRLRIAPNEQPRFMAFELSYVVTGTCELLKD